MITYADYRRFCEGRYSRTAIWASWVNDWTADRQAQAANQDVYLQSLVIRIWNGEMAIAISDYALNSIFDYAQHLGQKLAYAELGEDYFA